MAVQRRRIIYMTNEDWAWVTHEAKREGVTISALIRDRVTRSTPVRISGLGPSVQVLEVPYERTVPVSFRPVPKPTRKGK